MKRILSLILAGMLLAISLAGCSLPAFAVWSLDPSEDAPTAPQFDEVLEEVFEGDHGSYTLCFAVSYPRRLKVFGRLPLPIYWKRCSMYQEDGFFFGHGESSDRAASALACERLPRRGAQKFFSP